MQTFLSPDPVGVNWRWWWRFRFCSCTANSMFINPIWIFFLLYESLTETSEEVGKNLFSQNKTVFLLFRVSLLKRAEILRERFSARAVATFFFSLLCACRYSLSSEFFPRNHNRFTVRVSLNSVSNQMQTDLEFCDLRKKREKNECEEGKETQKLYFGFVINKSIRPEKEVLRVKYRGKVIKIYKLVWYWAPSSTFKSSSTFSSVASASSLASRKKVLRRHTFFIKSNSLSPSLCRHKISVLLAKSEWLQGIRTQITIIFLIRVLKQDKKNYFIEQKKKKEKKVVSKSSRKFLVLERRKNTHTDEAGGKSRIEKKETSAPTHSQIGKFCLEKKKNCSCCMCQSGCVGFFLCSVEQIRRSSSNKAANILHIVI